MKILIISFSFISTLCFSQEKVTLKEVKTTNFTTILPADEILENEKSTLTLSNSMERKVYTPYELTDNINLENVFPFLLPIESKISEANVKQYLNRVNAETEK